MLLVCVPLTRQGQGSLATGRVPPDALRTVVVPDRRRIDLLALDKAGGRLVVIELKRTDDGGHMEL